MKGDFLLNHHTYIQFYSQYNVSTQSGNTRESLLCSCSVNGVGEINGVNPADED